MLTAIPIDAGDAGLAAALSASGLPIDDLTDPGRQFYRFDEDGGTVGFGGLEPYGGDVLLRSVVVLPHLRGNGHGAHIARHLLDLATRDGADHTYLLTTSAAGFFARLGFTPLDRNAAPASIRGTRQATTICSSAALLARATSPDHK